MVSKDTSFDYLPYEINKYIYDIVCLDNTPLYNYRMRFINNNFKIKYSIPLFNTIIQYHYI